MSKRSHLETGFLRTWEAVYGLDLRPEREYRFAAPDRQWRFDFCWPAFRVAVEIDGGIFVGGGHNRGLQFTQNCEKLNAAVMRGWRVLRFTTLDLRQQPVQCVEAVGKLIEMIAGQKFPKIEDKQRELFA